MRNKVLFGLGLYLACWMYLVSSAAFDKAYVYFNPRKVKTPLDITFDLRSTIDIKPELRIGIAMPRFTRYFYETNETRQNITYSELNISPSFLLEAQFIEGVNFNDIDGNNTIPYSGAMVMIKTRANATIPSFTPISIKIFKENKIGAVCGFPSSQAVNFNPGYFEKFKTFKIFTLDTEEISYSESVTTNGVTTTETMYRNITIKNNDSIPFSFFDGVGEGCAKMSLCNGHGTCDYCYETCKCFEGYGNVNTDLLAVGSPIAMDCSQRVCPKGRAIGDLPTKSNKAHAMAECSNQGICDRTNGTCVCFPPFQGIACERMSCPNDCSGHGRCVSVGDLSKTSMLKSLYREKQGLVYGTGAGFDTVAWDSNTIYGCVCDSSWPVGYGRGETQLAEYFGPDCSLKRCPSGDDPYTSADETHCFKMSQNPNNAGEVGKLGNKCHIDCSNRGICDFNTGECKCFPGMWGAACNKIAGAGRTYERVAVDGSYEEEAYIAFEGN